MRTFRSIALVCTLAAAAACNAQEKKKGTVHIRTVQNINGVTSIKDTTYNTDDPLAVTGDVMATAGDGEAFTSVTIDGDDISIRTSASDGTGKGQKCETKMYSYSYTNGDGSKTKQVTVLKKVRISEPGSADLKKLGMKDAGTLKADHLNIYPNPSDARVNVSFEMEGEGTIDVAIFDLNGKRVFHEVKTDFTGSYDRAVDLSGQPKGVYLLKVTLKDEALVKKVFLE